jgi:AcrR family transcriptional regulator
MPQQHRAQVTRDAILRAAAEEFERAGYTGTSLNAILDRGGFTKGAFYFHFPSKQALAAALVAAQDAAWPELRAGWLARDLDPLRTLVGMLNDGVARLAGDVVLRAGLRLSADRDAAEAGVPSGHWQWHDAVVRLLEAARDSGQLRADVDPAGAARVLVAAAVGARMMSATSGDFAGYPARMREVLRYLLPGVVTAEWLAEVGLPAE